jgi:hypothetical protein
MCQLNALGPNVLEQVASNNSGLLPKILKLNTQTLQLLTMIMEQHALKNVNNCLNANIYSYLETSGGQSFNPYLNAVHFFNTSVN